jgi:hypothetical protein
MSFATVVEATREMQNRLQDLRLVSFCKTTGGKGLHVVTPLAIAKRSALSWPQAKGFSPTTSADGARRPALYLIQMTKKPEEWAYLPRLSEQRSHADGRGAALAPRAVRRDCVDASRLETGQSGSRPQALHDPHGARTTGEEHGLERLLRRSAPGGRRSSS